MFEIVTHACYIHSLLYTVQPVTCPVFFLPHSFIIFLLFSRLKKLFAKYDHLVDCNQVPFALARTVLRPNYVINTTCKSDICTDLLLPMTSPHSHDTALNSTWERLKHPQPLNSTGLTRVLTELLEPGGYYVLYHQFNIQNSTFCPRSVFMCFVRISEQTAIFSLYSIN